MRRVGKAGRKAQDRSTQDLGTQLRTAQHLTRWFAGQLRHLLPDVGDQRL